MLRLFSLDVNPESHVSEMKSLFKYQWIDPSPAIKIIEVSTKNNLGQPFTKLFVCENLGNFSILGGNFLSRLSSA